MFGLGMGELLVILVLALLFLGPKRLPDVASSLGKAIRSFRKATRELTDQLEVDDTVKQPFRELTAALRDEPAQAVTVQASQEIKVAAQTNLAAQANVAAQTNGAARAPVAAAAATTSSKPAEPPKVG
jgi:TatA/E family protein of Tat protein translocase